MIDPVSSLLAFFFFSVSPPPGRPQQLFDSEIRFFIGCRDAQPSPCHLVQYLDTPFWSLPFPAIPDEVRPYLLELSVDALLPTLVTPWLPYDTHRGRSYGRPNRPGSSRPRDLGSSIKHHVFFLSLFFDKSAIGTSRPTMLGVVHNRALVFFSPPSFQSSEQPAPAEDAKDTPARASASQTSP